ncbi:MAG: phytoene desaturase family protein [Candidatus Gracilibacteria bacterium]|jgi:phytoene desaturase|nr:phytoene desaturase family protein [Candidatus Gracilibacteria bacterium]
MPKKKIIIVGAGPGGLTSAMLLAHRGFDVEVFEKDAVVGGRNQPIEEQGYKFDTGPTFLMMKFILDEVFEESGKKSEDYLKFIKLDPMYSLLFKDKEVQVSSDPEKMKAEIKNTFPGEEKSLEKMLKYEKKRFDKMFPCLQKEYGSFFQYFSKDFLKAFSYLSIGRSMFSELGKYFKSDDLKLSFTFQSKYLGMSAWECPAAFMIIPYIEHAFGIYHVIGGLSEISEKMSLAAKENGAKIHLNTAVKELILEGKKVIGVLLENGEKHYADKIIINSDFAYSMANLVPDGLLKKYSKPHLKKKKYSCSIFMMYLGVDKEFNTPFHQIVFAKDYKKNIEDIFKNLKLSNDTSFYVRNASTKDKTLAPDGHSALYILVPVPNNNSDIDWEKESENFKEIVLNSMEERTEYKDIRKHIKYEKIITPKDWETSYNVYNGATFNLAHSLDQMLYFRPHNKFEELENLYLVGGGTHPGSGLPTIYESARISANMICKKEKIPFTTKNLYI